MGVVVLIGVLLVLRWRLLDPSTLKTGHFPSRYRALVLTTLLANIPTDVPRRTISMMRDGRPWPQRLKRELPPRFSSHHRLTCSYTLGQGSL